MIPRAVEAGAADDVVVPTICMAAPAVMDAIFVRNAGSRRAGGGGGSAMARFEFVVNSGLRPTKDGRQCRRGCLLIGQCCHSTVRRSGLQ